jgi:deazaflavin-dependent oxidoreductase (nitroreductase family)
MAAQMQPMSQRGPAGGGPNRVPFFVPLFNPIVQRLMGAGVPFGPNALLGVRGRTTGLLRTTPIAVVEIGGRRWVQSPYGEVNWVRNLRASGEGILTVGRRQEPVTAVALTPDQAAAFFQDVLGPYIRRIPVGALLIGLLGAREILTDPVGAARRHPVFELHPAARTEASDTATV